MGWTGLFVLQVVDCLSYWVELELELEHITQILNQNETESRNEQCVVFFRASRESTK